MPSTLLTSIDRQVAADADAPALLDGSGALSRSALQGQSRRVAAALAAAGVLPGDAVAIAIPRSVASVVAVVGVLRAGAVYVPIDPAHPIERQRWIADNAACKAVLVEGAGPEGLSPALDLSRLPDAPAVSDRAEPTGRLNLLYTSGSTGRPKGVIGTQAAMQNRVDWAHAALPFQLGEVAAHRSALGFVDAGPEIFSALCAGVPLAVVSPAEQADLGRFVEVLRERRATRITLVPSMLAALLRRVPAFGAALPDLRLWVLSGEELTAPLLAQARAALPAATIVNLYGTTEVTGDVTAAVFAPGAPLPAARVPLGWPIAGAQLWVVGADGEAVEKGQPGELWAGGPPLAAGYHRSPKEEGHRFPLHPRWGRCFRTGDRVCLQADGSYAFLGRVDNLVKVSGVRIELEEVERALRDPGEELAVVHSQGRLVAVLAAGAAVEPLRRGEAALWASVQARAQARLPEVMRPAELWTVGRLPLSPNGKVDRRALVAALQADLRVLNPEEEPATEQERVIAALWAGILGRGAALRVGRDDTFAALGGGSLERAELVLALSNLPGGRALPAALIREGRLRELAAALEAPATAAPVDGRLSLTPFEPAPDVVAMVMAASAHPPIPFDADLPPNLDEAGARAYATGREGVVIRLDGLAVGVALVQHDPIVGDGVQAPAGAVQLDEWLLPAFQGLGLLGMEGAWPLIKAWLGARYRYEVSVVWEDHHAMLRTLEARGYQRLGRSYWRGLPGATPPEGPCEVWLCDLHG
jgi:amino acid adenylation domain-containing protein